MNAFNRVAFVIIVLLLMAAAVLLLVFPLQTLQTAVASLETLEENLIQRENFFLFYVIVLVAVLILLLFLLFLELRPRRKKSVRIRTEGAGQVQIGVDSVTQSLAYRIDELPGVRDVRPHLMSRGRDVRVRIDLRTSPTVNVPSVTEQIVDLAHDIIEGQLGVKIRGKVVVNVAHEPFPRGTLPPAAGRPEAEEAEPAKERPAARPRREREREVAKEPQPSVETEPSEHEGFPPEESPVYGDPSGEEDMPEAPDEYTAGAQEFDDLEDRQESSEEDSD